MKEDIKEYDISEFMDVPKEYYSISEPKLEITEVIKEALKEKTYQLET